MKLTLKGARKLMAWASNDIKGDLKDLEFNQEDFTGAVILTVKEAKTAHKCVSIEVVDLVNDFAPVDLIRELEEFEISLRNRIKQAEGI